MRVRIQVAKPMRFHAVLDPLHENRLTVGNTVGQIQGGSDISGTLSKLHHCIKKSYFSLILSRQTASAGWPIIDKQNRHIPAKMNQLEAIRAGTVSGLRAGRTVKVIMSYGDFRKKRFFAMIIGSLNISRTTVGRSDQRFWSQIDAVIAADGDFIE